MGTIKFSVNNKIEFHINGVVCKSDIQDVNDSFISISIPMFEGNYIPVKNGDEFQAVYYDSKNIYKFSTEIIGRRFEKIPELLIAIPKQVIKVQRRCFVRVSVLYDIKCAKYDEKAFKNMKTIDEKIFESALMIDLSGGGMRISTKQSFSLGDIIVTIIPICNGESIIKAKIVRKQKNDGVKQGYIYGLSFADLSNGDRDKIIKFVFQIMREQRKKV